MPAAVGIRTGRPMSLRTAIRSPAAVRGRQRSRNQRFICGTVGSSVPVVPYSVRTVASINASAHRSQCRRARSCVGCKPHVQSEVRVECVCVAGAVCEARRCACGGALRVCRVSMCAAQWRLAAQQAPRRNRVAADEAENSVVPWWRHQNRAERARGERRWRNGGVPNTARR